MAMNRGERFEGRSDRELVGLARQFQQEGPAVLAEMLARTGERFSRDVMILKVALDAASEETKAITTLTQKLVCLTWALGAIAAVQVIVAALQLFTGSAPPSP